MRAKELNIQEVWSGVSALCWNFDAILKLRVFKETPIINTIDDQTWMDY